MSAPRSYRATDARLNPELADEIATVRGLMEEAAERHALPPRFETFPHPNRAAMVLHDTLTGREVVVGLFAYGAVREVLGALFPEEG